MKRKATITCNGTLHAIVYDLGPTRRFYRLFYKNGTKSTKTPTNHERFPATIQRLIEYLQCVQVQGERQRTIHLTLKPHDPHYRAPPCVEITQAP